MMRGAVDMSALVHEVYEDLASERAGRNIEFRVADLPGVSGDAAMLRQVFANIVSNAIKFTRPRDPAVIEVDGRVEGAEAIFSVRDNGVGFDMRYVKKLFGVFQRLHTAEEFEGTGVGLALVQRIIHRHEGRVWVESVLGEGTVVRFALPIKS